MDEAVNPAADTAVETPATETVETPDYNDPNYDETAEVAPEPTPEVAEEPEVTPEVQTEAEPNEPSPRYEKRIRQLSAKVKELKTSHTPETPQVAPVQPQVPQVPVPQVQMPQLPPGDYTPEEINAWAQQQAVKTGQALASIEVQRLRDELALKDEVISVKNTFNNDLHAIETKYPELNEDSPDFDPYLSEVVTESYEEALLADPKTASLEKIASRIMGANRRAAAKASVKTAKAVASQRDTGTPASSASGPTKTSTKWTAESVAALSIDDYAANEAAIKRDLYGA